MREEGFERWYSKRAATVNKGGIVEAMLSLEFIKAYCREAYVQGYKDAIADNYHASQQREKE